MGYTLGRRDLCRFRGEVPNAVSPNVLTFFSFQDGYRGGVPVSHPDRGVFPRDEGIQETGECYYNAGDQGLPIAFQIN